MPTIGERIEEAMRGARLRKADLARACEVSWTTVNNWTTGKVHPKASSLERLAAVLDVSMEWLQTGVAPTGGSLDALEAFLGGEGRSASREEREFLRATATAAEAAGRRATAMGLAGWLATFRMLPTNG